jgi:hypothetical protein
VRGADGSPSKGPWCDLYDNGYAKEIDSIMDMYTPGDDIPEEVRPRRYALAADDAAGRGKPPFPLPFEAASVAAAHMGKGGRLSLEFAPFGDTDDGDALAAYSSGSRAHRENDALHNSSSGSLRAMPAKASSKEYDTQPAMLEQPVGITDDPADAPTSSREKYSSDHQGSNTKTDRKKPSSDERHAGGTGVSERDLVDEFEDEYPSVGHDRQKAPPAREPASSSASTYYLELAVYVLSGVLLIFILEQFVQLGLHMR